MDDSILSSNVLKELFRKDWKGETMKKIVMFIIVVIVVSALASCVPVEPKDMQPYCRQQYENLLIEHPDYPHAFIGACVSNLQSGNINAFASLCGYEPFRTQIEEEFSITLDTKKDCIDFIKNFQE
jgi:hypothetical protein